MPRIMNKHWADNVKQKKFYAEKFYSNVKKFNSQMENPKSFLGLQKNLLPNNWDK